MAGNKHRRSKDVAAVITDARKARSLSIRELGRRAGVSAGQISRIESGEVQRPAVETLVALARALDCNPVPLMIVAGHVTGDEARGRLAHFVADESELASEWVHTGDAEALQRMQRIVGDSKASPSDLRGVAADVFLTAETEETLWHDAYLALPTQGEGAEDLRELVSAWPSVDPGRRVRVLEFVRDQVALSRLDFANEMRAEGAADGVDH
mgnify:CR=1 FL=1